MRRAVAVSATAAIALVCVLSAVFACVLAAVPVLAAPVPQPAPGRDVFAVRLAGPVTAKVLDLTTAAGAGTVRLGNLDWSRAELAQGQLDQTYLAQWQASLAAAAAKGLRAEVTLFGTPAWAQAVPGSACGPVRPDAYDDFAAFAAGMVQRFSAAPYGVKRWEIWTEPDAPVTQGRPSRGCWGRPEAPDHGGRAFGELLRAAYPAIKRADPEATVVFGGLRMGCGVDGGACPTPRRPGERFLAAALAAGAGEAFDELAYHTFAHWTPAPAAQQRDPDVQAPAEESLLGRLQALRRLLGDLDKPIAVSEAALLWCAPAAEDPASWCARRGIAQPGDDYLQAQANYVVRLYTRAWANGIAHVGWHHLDAGGWRGSGLLGPDGATQRPGYHALAALAARLDGATYVGGSVTPGGIPAERVEDYRFCAGHTEHRIMWTNQAGATVQLQMPTGVVAATDKLGRPVGLGQTLTVGFEPVLLERDLGRPCVAGRPSTSAPVLADLSAHRVGEHWRQVAVLPGTAGATGTLFTRTSTDTAGREWPATWSRASMAEAFAGPAAGQPPPTDAVDALTRWQPPGQNGPRQEVFAGGGVWRRDAADPGAGTWGSWSSSSLATEWGGGDGAPPTDRVDAVAIRPGPDAGRWRQVVVAGDRMYVRDSPDGLDWPRAWRSQPLQAAWGEDANHPPTDRIDGFALQSTVDGQGRTRWRQTVVAGEATWTRLSTDQRGALWPAEWASSTLAASWGAAAAASERPPVWAAAGPYAEPAPRPAPAPGAASIAPATTDARSSATTATPPTLPGDEDVGPLGPLPLSGIQVAVGLLAALALLAGGSAMLLSGRRGPLSRGRAGRRSRANGGRTPGR